MNPPYPVIHMLARERENDVRRQAAIPHRLPAQQPRLRWRLATFLRRAADRIDPMYLPGKELATACAPALDHTRSF